MNKAERQRLDQLMAKALRTMGYEAVMEGFSEAERDLLAEIEANPGAFLRVRQAARVLQVTVRALQKYDRNGTLPAERHPLSGRRIYRLELINVMLDAMNTIRSVHAAMLQRQ